MLRFDLRDDRLRLQHIETQERDAFFSEIHAAAEAVVLLVIVLILTCAQFRLFRDRSRA
mgnify:CR=1 FL=1